MKIALINPPFLFPRKSEIVFSQCTGLRSISSFLKSTGDHEIHFIDALMLGFSNVKQYANGYIAGLEIHDIVALIPPDIELIGVSAPFSHLAPVVHNIIDRIKAAFPEALVVMGGIYPSTQPQLALTSKADCIVVGEGEHAMGKIAGGENPVEIPGVYAKESLSDEVFPPAEMIDNLDSLPFPDYDIPLMDKYFDLSQRAETGRSASLVTSRGCPFSCEFCSIHPVYGRKYRPRSAGKVIEEISYLVNRHAVKSLEIEDDNFTLRKERTINILEGIIHLNEKGAGLGWITPNGIRIDTLDEDLIRLIKQSNCRSIALAIEHGDPDMLRIMNKKLSLDRAFRVIELLVRYNIPRISLFIIVGYPGETRERFLNSLAYLKKIKGLGGNLAVSVHIAQPYPGTRLLARLRKEGIITDRDFGNFLIKKDLMGTGLCVPINTPDFDTREVLRRKNLVSKVIEPGWKHLVKRFMPEIIDNTRFIQHIKAAKGAFYPLSEKN